MSFLKHKHSAWDQIKDAVAQAAESAGDVHQRVHARVADGASHVREAMHDGAHASADAVRTGASAVGRGLAAVDQKVEDVANGVLAGAIAGAMAAWMMNQFQTISAKPVAQRTRDAEQGQKSDQGGGDNATTKVAEAVVGHGLTREQKPTAGAAVHYSYGAAMGALYGGLAELVPAVGMGLGIPYATALWLFGDEIAVPALGLSKPPTATTPAEHAAALSSHFVYGVTLDIARRVLRHIV